MRIKCIANTRAALSSPSAIASFDEHNSSDEVWLEIGRTYDVYGIALWNGEPWYLVCDDEDDTYPKPHLGAFFTIADPSIPSGWAVTLEGNLGSFAILPRRWADDPAFLEKLIDDDPAALAHFAELRKRTS